MKRRESMRDSYARRVKEGKARGVQMKRSRLAQRSQSGKQRDKIYRMKRRAFLLAHPWCEATVGMPCVPIMPQPAVDVHHMAGREGSNYLDESTWKASCRGCHDWIHKHPNNARSRGLLL
jgi:hypothetical protein